MPRQALTKHRADQAAVAEAGEAKRRLATAAAEVERKRLQEEASKVYEWNADELALLIKSVKKCPAGTRRRWEVIAGELMSGGVGGQWAS